MKKKPQQLLTSVRWSILYLIFIPTVVSMTILWISHQRISDFKAAQLDIAQSTTDSVAKEVAGVITHQKRLVRLFAQKEQAILAKMALNPHDVELKLLLEGRIKEFFPDYFTFTLADNHGDVLIDDFEGYLGEVCTRDIHTLADAEDVFIQVHPNPYVYHIDVMSKWRHQQQSGIFFISFKLDSIARLLALSSQENHQLMLINTQIPGLIEVMEGGARNIVLREDYRLNDEERARILYSTPVEHSAWELTDFYVPGLFSNYKKEIYRFSVSVILLFVLGSLIMIWSLLRAERRRQDAEELSEEMFSIFSHDLRSPLTSIIGTLHLIPYEITKLGKEEEGATIIQFARMAARNAQVMLGLVNDMLDVKKLEYEGMEFDFAELDIVELVVSTVEMNRQLAESYEVSIETALPDTPLQIRGDERRLQQALTNLVSNAVKYSPKHASVSVTLTRRDEKVCISVSDKGPGIPLAFQESIFEKFSQSSSEYTKRVGGTGLGLRIVKHICDAHHGRVHFESAADKGTVFFLELPLARID